MKTLPDRAISAVLRPRETLKACRMTTLSTAARVGRAFFAQLADWLAVGVAVALP